MFLLQLAGLQASILRFSLSLSKNQASISHLKGLAQLPTYKTQRTVFRDQRRLIPGSVSGMLAARHLAIFLMKGDIVGVRLAA